MILYSFASACLAFVLIEVLNWHKQLGWEQYVYDGDRFKTRLKYFMDRKPLNCVVCLSGWLALVIGLISGQGWESLLMMPVAMVASIFIDRLAKS